MKIPGPFPFKGEVVWLAAEQGGRKSGPPPDPSGYAQIAHVPPGNVALHSASFVLRGWDPDAWRSPAEGRWLVIESEGEWRVEPGSVVVVAEGPAPVAYFHVDYVMSQAD